MEKVDSFRYLGRTLAQDNDDVRAVRQQIKKARAIWARVGQVLTAENTPPKVSDKIYKAVMQSVLLYEQDMEPHDYCLSTAQAVSHLRSLPNGRETQAEEGAASQVGLPVVL